MNYGESGQPCGNIMSVVCASVGSVHYAHYERNTYTGGVSGGVHVCVLVPSCMSAFVTVHAT